jgi:hypothetical protein
VLSDLVGRFSVVDSLVCPMASAVPAMAVLATATAAAAPVLPPVGPGKAATSAAGKAASAVAASLFPPATPPGLLPLPTADVGGARKRKRGPAPAEASAAAPAASMTSLLALLSPDGPAHPMPVPATAVSGAVNMASLVAAGLDATQLTQTLDLPDGATWVQLCRELQSRHELQHLQVNDRTVRFLKDVRAMTKRERELYLLVLLKEGREEPAPRTAGDPRMRRARYTYAVQPFGRLERKAFCMLFDIRAKYLRNLQAHLAATGSVMPRTHGNVGRVPNNRKLAREHVQFAEGWIREFGRRNGQLETVRIRHRIHDKVEIVRRQVLVINTSTSIAQLFKHFREAFVQAFPGVHCFGEETFRRIVLAIDDVRIRRSPY